MSRFIALGLAAALLGTVATAQTAPGTVTEFTGQLGDLVVSRDGVSYSLITGGDLAFGDIVRATNAGEATLTFNGCTHTIPAGQDFELNAGFCDQMAALEAGPTSLAAAEAAGPVTEAAGTAAAGNAPLIIGGVVVAAGGIAAAAGGGGGDDTPAPTSP
ncbi:MAG: hypothetical protein ABJH52_08175 [Henriciella sp.]